MAEGDIGSVVDTLEFDTDTAQFPDIVHISGNVFAVVYSGPVGVGRVATFTVASDGTISNAVIDTLEFDTSAGTSPIMINISGDIYGITYSGASAARMVATIDIDSSGNIGAAVIDTLDLGLTSAGSPESDIINISGDIYAIAYADSDSDGQVATVDIDSSGNIGAAAIDTLEFDTATGVKPSIIQISGTMYAVAYRGVDGDGFVVTFNIASDGTIDNSVTASLEFDTGSCTFPRIRYVAGNIFAIAYEGVDGDGFVKTLTIASNGTISSVIDTLEWDTANGFSPDFIRVRGLLFAVAYEDTDTDGILKTFIIGTDGTLGAVLGTLEFETTQAISVSLILHPFSEGTVAIAYRGEGIDGFVKTALISVAGKTTTVIAIVETRFHYVDVYGTERYIEGTPVT